MAFFYRPPFLQIIPDSTPVSQSPSDPDKIRLTHDYQRRAEVEMEISTLPNVGTLQFGTVAAHVEHRETLVHSIRRLVRAGDERQSVELVDLLLQRAMADLKRIAASHFPMSQSDRDDVVQNAALQTYEEVCDTSAKEEFWEVNFTRMLQCACSDAADKIRGQREHEQQFDQGTDDDGTPWSGEDRLADLRLVDVDARVEVHEMLTLLDDNVRRAIFLRAHGYKAKSSKPGEPSISGRLNVSDRTVRTYLRKGEEIIREYRVLADRQLARIIHGA